MAKKKKAIDPGPSKAYLLSFGDTMTALLAFFIVLNSLAKDQTGANMYAGTGSFVTAFAKSGTAGGMPGNRSRDMIQQTSQAPIYALAENLDKNKQQGKVGPDDVEKKDRIKNRDREQFQKFLAEMDSKFGLKKNAPAVKQVVFDSFMPFSKEDGKLVSEHALQLAADIIPKVRNKDRKLEVIVWARMPSKSEIDRQLLNSYQIREEIESLFWIDQKSKDKFRYSVKPWLFSDAKRPVISFVYTETRPATE